MLIVIPLAILGGWQLGLRLDRPSTPPGSASSLTRSFGAEIGITVTRETLVSLREAYLPLKVLTVAVFAVSLVGAWLVSRSTWT